MVLGTGIDIVSVARIEKSVRRYGKRFLNKIFTHSEIAYSRGRAREVEHLAARFAAKEAVLKAFGTGASGGASVREVEVVNDDRGKPEIILHGATLQLARERHVGRVHLSLAHTDEMAAAQVVIETA